MKRKATNSTHQTLRLEGVEEHNLKGLDLEFEHDQLVVFVGVSGSGKSSLVFDTIFREGERRILANLGSRTSRLMHRMGRPRFAAAEGIRPAIAVDQNSHVTAASSTVGTLSEIGDDLRLLFARFAKRHCHSCGLAIETDGKREAPAFCGCGTKCPPLSRSLFSFNTPAGSCPSCRGLGIEERVDAKHLIADSSKSLRDGALVPTTPTGYVVYSQVTPDSMNEVCQAHGFSIDIPWCELSDEQRDVILWGSDRIKVAFGKHSLESRMKWSGIKAKPREMGHYRGILRVIEETLKKKRNANILRFVSSHPCQACEGSRLSAEARAPKFQGRTISDFGKMGFDELRLILESASPQGNKTHRSVMAMIVSRITERIDRLQKLSLGHLTLDRPSRTLSSGESRRLRLATQLGSGLTGIIYVFDEPSSGLHQQERHALFELLCQLRDLGNTVLVVEHDRHFRQHADHVVEIGPGSGRGGGELVYSGRPRPHDLAMPSLEFHDSGKATAAENQFFDVGNANDNNLKNLHVTFRRGALNIVTGLSGSGKTSLIAGSLARAARQTTEESQGAASITGGEFIKHVLVVDQKPIGRSPRSNPATWSGVFDQIRTLFANTEVAKGAKFDKGHFSFNKPGGRCETCEGAGIQTVGLMSMPLLILTCDECDGSRFDHATLQVLYQGHSIKDVLDATIDDAANIFRDDAKIVKILGALQSLGLGYLQLGQPAPTLSGGEAQRLKLAKEMAKTKGSETLIILDEPSNGLHDLNIAVLGEALLSLTKKGCTIVAADHDLSLVCQADWLIELGPRGGEDGGQLIYAGPPIGILKTPNSATGTALSQTINSTVAAPLVTQLQPRNYHKSKATSFTGIRTNNLKSIDATFPYGQVTAVGGVSGSGKTSLVFDTLAAEGLSRFAESFSPYLRREIRASRMGEFDHATGIRATIAIRSKTHLNHSTSTVGTHSGLDESLRLLFARVCESQGPRSLTLTASHFSFNHALGACPACAGKGEIQRCQIEALLADPKLTIANGALLSTKGGASLFELDGRLHANLLAVAKSLKINLDQPWGSLSKQEQATVARGCGDVEFEVEWQAAKKKGEAGHSFISTWAGVENLVEVEYEKKRERKAGPHLAALLRPTPCRTCKGSRLKSATRDLLVGPWTITDLRGLEVNQLVQVIEDPTVAASKIHGSLKDRDLAVFRHLAQAMKPRLLRLQKLGLGHLTLDRSTRSLSTGEARRLDLAKQLTDGLQDTCYVLDEPGLGLHAQDKMQLGQVIRELAHRGNTVVVVDHDRDLLRQADHIIDIGPKAGQKGGSVVAQGSVQSIIEKVNSPTGALLRGETRLQREFDLRAPVAGPRLTDICAHNLKDISLQINFGEFLVICGVSGSGKSTLLFDVVEPSIRGSIPIGCAAIEGNESTTDVHRIDGQAHGKGPFSVVATFLNLMDPLKKIFASTEDAKTANLKTKDFSFAGKSGRCPQCLGSGESVMSLDFLPDAVAPCPLCKGQRFNKSVLQVHWNGLTLADFLGQEIAAIEDSPLWRKPFTRTLQVLKALGLGHLSLDRRCDSLSGGENARLGIVRQLISADTQLESSVFLFDEASRGLHVEDQAALQRVFETLVNSGAAVVASEHALDLIHIADRVVELGPGAGRHGGQAIFDGTPAELHQAQTPTGQSLRTWHAMLK